MDRTLRSLPATPARLLRLSAFVLGVLAPILGAGSPSPLHAQPVQLSDLISLSSEPCNPQGVDLAPHPEGGFFAAWHDGFVRVQRHDAHGAALARQAGLGEEGFVPDIGPRVAVSPTGAAGVLVQTPEGDLDVAVFAVHFPGFAGRVTAIEATALGSPLAATLLADGDDGFVVVAVLPESVAVVRVGLDGDLDPPVRQALLTEENLLSGFPLGDFDAVLQPDGDLWLIGNGQFVTSPPSGAYTLARLPAGTDEIEKLAERGELNFRTAALATAGPDAVAVAWNDHRQITLEIFDDQGARLGEPRVVATRREPAESVPGTLGGTTAFESDEAGNLLVTWSEQGGSVAPAVRARALTPEGEPAGPAFTVAAFDLTVTSFSSARAGAGRAFVAWTGFTDFAIGTPPPCSLRSGPFGRPVNLGGPEGLLLGDGRFRVEVDWQVPSQGTEGRGMAIPGTADTGSFWFFEPDNVELTVKLLDARTINGHFWFFFGALTDVGYQITVTDQVTGESKTYRGESGVQDSFADVMAFAAVP